MAPSAPRGCGAPADGGGRLQRREPGHRLVEQQQLGRVARARAISSRFLSASVRVAAAMLPRPRSSVNSSSSVARARASADPVRALERAAHHVVQRRHAAERAHHLPGARDAETADALGAGVRDVVPVEEDAAVVGMHVAGDAVEQRRLAGAVGPDEARRSRPASMASETSRLASRPPKRLVEDSTLQQRGGIRTPPTAARPPAAASGPTAARAGRSGGTPR